MARGELLPVSDSPMK